MEINDDEYSELIRQYLFEKRGGKPDPYPDNERQLGVFYKTQLEFIDCDVSIRHPPNQNAHLKTRDKHLQKLDLYRWMYNQKNVQSLRMMNYLETYHQLKD